LCIRYDALGENSDGVFGSTNKDYIEAKLKKLEKSVIEDVKGGSQAANSIPKYKGNTDRTQYNTQSDFVPKKKKMNE